MELQSKIDKSIDLLKKGEAFALSLNPLEGYFVAFSGGKDSQALLELVKMSGVRYHAVHSVTGVDDPVTIHFIKSKYPEVKLYHPKEKYLRLVSKKGLPIISRRFCCERLKERVGVGEVVLTGVRAEESRKRAAYSSIMINSRRKEHEGMSVSRDENWLREVEHQCIKGQDRVMIHPVLDWSVSDVWQFLAMRNVPVNPCYTSVGRVGCMFCPFASRKQIEYYEKCYPKYYKAVLRAVSIYWEKCESHILSSPQEYYDWWKSGKSIKTYLKQKSKNGGLEHAMPSVL